jgi:hypothetical protein
MRASSSVTLLGSICKLEKLIPLLGSDKPGEVLAAVGAIERHLKSVGADWHALAAVIGARAEQIEEAPADWRDSVEECLCANWRLSPKERSFLHTIRNFSSLSPKQSKWLTDILRRVRPRAA